MEGMGHFPMSENPVEFKKYLMPVLADIEQKDEVAAA
jgi:pimeloyl-ACP methyl ester carboxylesterase